MKILVTGSASHLAKTCIPYLLENSNIQQIIGIDIQASTLSHTKYQEQLIDVRSEKLADHFTDIDAVVHFAFITNNGALASKRFDREYIREINVEGSKHVFQLAAKNNIKTLIHFSSAVVYGLSAETPSFIDESQPLKPCEGFFYSEDKVAVERYLDEFEKQHSSLRVVRFRPHVVLGQYAQPLLKTVLSQPFHFIFPDPQPLTQCISETDVATALQQALFTGASGAFNLATDQVASFHWIHKHLHKYSLPLPFSIAKRCQHLAWKYSGRYGDPAWLECMRYPLTISNDKAKQALNWAPTLNLFECLEATV